MYLVMYGHVEALRLNGLQFSVDKALQNFVHYHKIEEGEGFSMDAARKAYFQMNKEYMESQKTEHGNS